MYEQASLLREHGKEITDIIEAMKEGPENEEVRTEIAAALAHSLKEEEMRTGGTRPVKDTDLYRLAQAVRQSRNQKECATLVKRAFPRRWSTIFEKYDFDWKFSCREIRPMGRKQPPGKTAKGPISGIEGEVEDLEKAMKELDEHVEELTKEIRKHEEQ